MKIKQLFILCLSLLSILVIFSCNKDIKKNSETSIEGSWTKTNVENINSDVIIEWHIENGKIYVLQYLHSNFDSIDTLYHGYYAIKIKNFKKILNIFESTNNYEIGEWTINKLTSKYLFIYRQQGGLEYMEFSK